MINFLRALGLNKKSQAPTTAEEIEQIHKEFYTAGEYLLAEAKEVLRQSEQASIQKGQRLNDIGFVNTKEAAEYSRVKGKIVVSEKTAKAINYYRKKYPLSKFITEDAVASICRKYNLVCGEVCLYTGFVPEKNLKEIESFIVKAEDLDKPTLIVTLLNKDDENSKKLLNRMYSLQDSGKRFKVRGSSSARYISVEDKYFWVSAVTEIRNDRLLICAPAKDMDLRQGKIYNGKILHKSSFTTKHYPDPIVLQQVKGGYLIVTAWGDEASDPYVINDKMN